MKKKFLSLLLALAMCLSLSVPAWANASPDDVNSVLLERGYPQVYLDYISDSAKESLYSKSDLVFEGATISVFDEDSGAFSEYNVTADGLTTRAQIPTADLSLTWGISRSSTSGNVLITYSYDWNNLPAFRFEDPICISWNDTYFEMLDNSFYKVDKYKQQISYTGYTGPIQTFVHSEERAYADGASCGVTWYADLVGQSVGGVISLFGHGEFWLVPKQSSFTTTFYGKYVHNMANVQINLEIPVYGSGATISGGDDFAQMGNQRTYTYY